jgi:hypothetical protein
MALVGQTGDRHSIALSSPWQKSNVDVRISLANLPGRVGLGRGRRTAVGRALSGHSAPWHHLAARTVAVEQIDTLAISPLRRKATARSSLSCCRPGGRIIIKKFYDRTVRKSPAHDWTADGKCQDVRVLSRVKIATR